MRSLTDSEYGLIVESEVDLDPNAEPTHTAITYHYALLPDVDSRTQALASRLWYHFDSCIC